MFIFKNIKYKWGLNVHKKENNNHHNKFIDISTNNGVNIGPFMLTVFISQNEK